MRSTIYILVQYEHYGASFSTDYLGYATSYDEADRLRDATKERFEKRKHKSGGSVFEFEIIEVDPI